MARAHGLNVERLVPAVDWLRHYPREWLRADVLGGLAAGAVVIPQAMAYATIAGMPVEVGLYTCMVPMVVYALLGGSRVASVSTTSTVATLTASTLTAAGVAATSSDPLGALSTLVLLVGVILLLARLAHLGPLIDNISDALLIGLRVGVGLTVAAGQLPKLSGLPADPDAAHFFSEVRSVIQHLGDTSVVTAVFSAATVGLLVGLKRWAPRFPAPLLAVAGGILLVKLADLPAHGVALIAEVPSGLPTPDLPRLEHLSDLLPGAIAIALMVYLETVAVGRSMRRPTDRAVDNDQELVATGAACVAGGLLPVDAGRGRLLADRGQRRCGRTDAAVRAHHGRAGRAHRAVPRPGPERSARGHARSDGGGGRARAGEAGRARAAVSLRSARVRGRRRHGRCSPGRGLAGGRGGGVILNVLLLLHELNHAGMTELRPAPDGRMLPVSTDASPAPAPVPGLLALRVRAPLSTGNVRVVQREILARVDALPEPPKVVVLDATVVGILTMTVLGVVEETERLMAERGVALWVASLPDKAMAMARTTAGWSTWEDGRVYRTVEDAVTAFRGS